MLNSGVKVVALEHADGWGIAVSGPGCPANPLWGVGLAFQGRAAPYQSSEVFTKLYRVDQNIDSKTANGPLTLAATQTVPDGNVDPVAWSNNGSDQVVLSTALRRNSDRASARTEGALWWLCAEAGADRCAFAAESAEATAAKWATLLERLKRQPVEYRGLTMTYAVVATAINNRMAAYEQLAGFASWGNTVCLRYLVCSTIYGEK